MRSLRLPLTVLLAAVSFAAPGFAQSPAGFTQGQVPTAAEWNNLFAGKIDVTGGNASGANVTATGSTTARTLAARAADAANVLDYGADKTGATSSTSAVQSALNAGVTALYFPPGSYQVCGVVVPSTSHLVIYGNGVASQLVQPSGCSSPIFSWAQTAIAYTEGYIRDLLLDGTSGAADLIDTRGVGGITLQNL